MTTLQPLLLFVFSVPLCISTSIIYISKEEYWQDHHGTDLTLNNQKLYPPSFNQAQEYCQSRYGTDLASDIDAIHAVLSRIQDNAKIYVGFRQEIYSQRNSKGSHWVTIDGSDCPSLDVDKKGFRLCAPKEQWSEHQPDNFLDWEHCAEMSKHDHLNDIICSSVPYGWIVGFVCNAPLGHKPHPITTAVPSTSAPTTPAPITSIPTTSPSTTLPPTDTSTINDAEVMVAMVPESMPHNPLIIAIFLSISICLNVLLISSFCCCAASACSKWRKIIMRMFKCCVGTTHLTEPNGDNFSNARVSSDNDVIPPSSDDSSDAPNHQQLSASAQDRNIFGNDDTV